MDVIAALKAMQCNPGPVHSPNECPCDMEPCACVTIGAAIDEIGRLRAVERHAREYVEGREGVRAGDWDRGGAHNAYCKLRDILGVEDGQTHLPKSVLR